MKEAEFVDKNRGEWAHYSDAMDKLERGKDEMVDVEEIPKLVRKRCSDLALSRYRMYGMRVCENLNYMVTRGHKLVAKAEGGFRERIVHFFMAGFPQAIRREWRLFVVCWVFFLLPFFAMWLSYNYDQEWVHSMLSEDSRANMDSWYGKDDSTGAFNSGTSARPGYGSNFRMFAHYVNNNTGIDLLIISGGALAGVGSLFFLFSNGLQMGSSLAYVLYEGSPEKLLSFVSSHAPYELTGMIVAGMAGMRIGLAMIKPGQLSRGRALLESGKRGLPLMIGACCLTFFAAIIEGFWSAEVEIFGSPISVYVKYWIGYIGWALLAYYFMFAGWKGAQNA